MRRDDEIRVLLGLTPEAVMARAGERLMVCDTLDDLHERMARDIYEEIAQDEAQGRTTTLILPVGPVGQYDLLARMLIEAGISLAGCTFFFMDEYCDAEGRALPAEHPLSFKGVARALFLGELLAHTDFRQEQAIFPDEHNVGQLGAMIAACGGIDTCYGGIGIHGHVAFNEPEAGVRMMGARRVRLNDFTVTINAIRAQVGGNLEGFPRYAYTLGMTDILGARRIRLYCRNGVGFDWANTVLRLALLGTPDDDYPVTYMREHDAYTLITDRDTLASPRFIV